MRLYLVTFVHGGARVARNIIAPSAFRAICIALNTITASERFDLADAQMIITTKPIGAAVCAA